MKRIGLFLYQLLNHAGSKWLVIFIATLSKAILTAVFSNYEGDKSFYLLLAKNIGNGHGLTIPVSLLNTPAITEQVYFQSAISPFYSIVAVPLLKLFPENYFLVSWLIESASWLLLFIILHRILSLIIKENFWPNLFILFSGFFLYNLELSSSSKDVLATAFLMTGFLRCIQIASSAKPPSFLSLIISSLIFLLPGLTKFIYLPVTLVFPISLLFISFLNKEKWLLRTGALCLLVSCLLVAVHYMCFQVLDHSAMKNHEAAYFTRWSLSKTGDEFIGGFYPQNLLLLYPFLPASLFNLDFAGIQIRAYVQALYKPYAVFLYVINLAGILGLAYVFINKSKKYYRKTVPPYLIFLFCGCFIGFSILILTCIWSLRFRAIEYKGGVSAWTYVFENRPYFFFILFFQLLLVIFVFSKKWQSHFMKSVKTGLLLITGFGFLHGFYFLVKTSLNNKTLVAPSVNKLIAAETDSLKHANPSKNIWLATEMQHLDWYAKLKGLNVKNNLSTLNDPGFQLPKNTILVTALSADDTTLIYHYILRKDVTRIRNYNDTWLVYLQASQ